MNKSSLEGKRVWVAGHSGMVGSAIVRRLASENCALLTASRSELDLKDQQQTRHWIAKNKPDFVFIAAAKVGGILANDTYPADYIYENLVIETNIIEGSHRADVEKLLFLGSSCIYPKFAPQPIQESALLTGALETTNQWYAIAKIAGVKLCEAYRAQYGRNYISAMPTNLYGPGDNYNLLTSHVIPALIRKIHDAKLARAETVTVWGTGSPRREFLHVDDCADAAVFLMKHYSSGEPVNIGSGTDMTIAELAQEIVQAIGFNGKIAYDTSKPDGTPRKLMSNQKIQRLGWKSRIALREGLRSTYKWYLEHMADVRS